MNKKLLLFLFFTFLTNIKVCTWFDAHWLKRSSFLVLIFKQTRAHYTNSSYAHYAHIIKVTKKQYDKWNRFGEIEKDSHSNMKTFWSTLYQFFV